VINLLIEKGLLSPFFGATDIGVIPSSIFSITDGAAGFRTKNGVCTIKFRLEVPSTNNFSIYANGEFSRCHLSMYDSTGQLLGERLDTLTAPYFNENILPVGVYYLQMKNTDGSGNDIPSGHITEIMMTGLRQ
jgi:hypothetical protein